MISYTNETKVKDLPEITIREEVKALLKTAMLDYGSDMGKEVFEHSYNRLAYLIHKRYKLLLLGEVKYVFECLIEHIKGKLSVSAIMGLFQKYMDAKIEKQRQENEASDLGYERNIADLSKSPLGLAIIYKMNMVETGELDIKTWDSYPIKSIATKITSGEIKIKKPETKKRRYVWDN